MPAAGSKAARLAKQLSDARKTADQTQRSALKAEDVLSDLEDREERRTQREVVERSRAGFGGGH